MTRAMALRMLAVVVLALCAWWWQAHTEWVDELQPRPAIGEAREHSTYAFEQLLRHLGLHVERHEELDHLPPEGARLLLLSNDWDLMPGRAEQLHQWVLRGGHLLLFQSADWDDTRLAGWVPIYAQQRSRAERVAAAASAASAAEDDDDSDEGVGHKTKSADPSTLLEDDESFSTCMPFNESVKLRAKAGHEASWQVKYPEGVEVLRVMQGQGSVTVLNSWTGVLVNGTALDCDNPMLLARAVQARPGAVAWIYLNEKREALLPWLWHRAWIAILPGLLALFAALWRGALRFGPRAAPPSRHRRSIGEQVRGTGAYLHAHGGEALLAAQQRALEETAARHISRYRQMPSVAREQAIAKATQLDPEAVTEAMSRQTSRGARLSARLHLLESARRLLNKTKDERPTP